jgi:hypothetical protein
MPEACRVPQRADCIAAKVAEIYRDGIPTWAKLVQNHVRPETSLEGFGLDLLRAWAEMTASRFTAAAAPALPRQDCKPSSGPKRKLSLATGFLSDRLMESFRLVPLSPVSLLRSP